MAQMMSVYRERSVPFTMEFTNCLAQCVTEADTSLASLCLRTSKPVLIGLDNQPSIIKPVEAGDEALRFEALYDTCYSLVDLKKMQAAGVDNPADVPPDLYRVDLDVGIDGTCRLALALFAKDIGDTRAQFRAAFAQDLLFRETLCEKIAEIIIVRLLKGNGEIGWNISDVNQIREDECDLQRTPGAIAWRFLDDP